MDRETDHFYSDDSDSPPLTYDERRALEPRGRSRQSFAGPVSIELAMEMVRARTHCLLIWNACYGGGPRLSEDGLRLKRNLVEEGFDSSTDVILMEVLRRLGPGKATGKFSAFGLGLIERKYKIYTILHEYDGLEDMDPDPDRFVKDEVEKHLVRNGAITKEEYIELLEEAERIQIIFVEV